MLKTAGRNHNGTQALETYRKAREAGFENITVDLMFGIPGQTLEDVYNDIKIIKEIKEEDLYLLDSPYVYNKECKSCNNIVDEGFEYCPHCGNKIF